MDDDYDILKKHPDRISIRVKSTKDSLATKEREKPLSRLASAIKLA